MYFWTLNSNMFAEFLDRPHLSLQVKRAGIFCARTLRCAFTVGAIKILRISLPRKMVLCFATMFVPLWKLMTMNITQISGACSLIRQKWAWSWFYSTAEIDSPPFISLKQPTWRQLWKCEATVGKRLSMTNLSGRYVVIWRLWHCYWECNSDTQNAAVCCE